jgi:transcriptional regulator with XRE-family HTH domain
MFTKPADEQFKQWFYQQKEASGLTIDEIASRCGYSRGHIYNVLRTDKEISIPFCFGLATAFGVSAQDILHIAGFQNPVQINELAPLVV